MSLTGYLEFSALGKALLQSITVVLGEKQATIRNAIFLRSL